MILCAVAISHSNAATLVMTRPAQVRQVHALGLYITCLYVASAE